MEIALTKREQRDNTPPQNISCIMKKTYQIKTTKLVPVFAARWHLFCKYFVTPGINNQMKQTKATMVYRNCPVTP